MGFTRVKYQTNNYGIVGAVLSDTEVAVAGTQPTDPAVGKLTVYTSGSRRRHGIHARGVILTRDVGTAPDTAAKTTFLPALTPTAYASAAFQEQATVMLNGFTWTVARRVDELER